MISKREIPKDFFKKSCAWTVFELMRIWGTIFICIILLRFEVQILHVITFLFVGVMQYHLNVLGHDGIHFSLCENKRLNDFLSRWFVEAPLGAPLSALRANHLNHHSTLGTYHDADSQYYQIKHIRGKKAYYLWVLSTLLGFFVFKIIKKLIATKGVGNSIKRKGALPLAKDFFAILICQGVLYIIFLLVTGDVRSYFFFWVGPLFILMFGLSSVRSHLEHVLVRGEISEDRLRSFASNPIERYFLAPLNMNYHAEHHLYPSIPCRHLPKFSLFLRGKISVFISSSYVGRMLEVGESFDMHDDGAPEK